MPLPERARSSMQNSPCNHGSLFQSVRTHRRSSAQAPTLWYVPIYDPLESCDIFSSAQLSIQKTASAYDDDSFSPNQWTNVPRCVAGVLLFTVAKENTFWKSPTGPPTDRASATYSGHSLPLGQITETQVGGRQRLWGNFRYLLRGGGSFQRRRSMRTRSRTKAFQAMTRPSDSNRLQSL